MRTWNIPFTPAALGAALLGHLGPAYAAYPPSPPPFTDAVIITGWLHVEDLSMDDVVLDVFVDGYAERAHVTSSGRFTVILPPAAEATLRFEKPGHLPKEVVVDTHHAWDRSTNPRTRRIQFAVIMELERHMAGFTYPGPVGNIGFDKGGGCLVVAHDRSLVPAERAAPMVF